MYKDILRSIVGIEIFPVVSLLLFALVFMVMLFRVIRMDRGDAEHLASLPLDGVDGLTASRQEICQ